MLTELLREEQLPYILAYYKKDQKHFTKSRKIGMLLYAFLALIVLLFFGKLVSMWYIVPLAALIGYKLPYIKLISKKNKDDHINAYLFPRFISSYIALIGSTQNPYDTLKLTVPYIKGELQDKVIQLIEGIDRDGSRDHFIAVADYVNTTEAYMVMDRLYTFQTHGVDEDALKELEQHIAEIQNNRMDDLIKVKMTRMESVGLMPLFISMVFVIGFAGILMIYYLQDVGSIMGGATDGAAEVTSVGDTTVTPIEDINGEQTAPSTDASTNQNTDTTTNDEAVIIDEEEAEFVDVNEL